MDASRLVSTMEALPETDHRRTAYEALRQDMSVLESSDLGTKARDLLGKLTPEDVQGLLPVELVQSQELDEATRRDLMRAVTKIAEVNPEAVSLDQYDLVLDQVGGSQAQFWRKSLETAKRILLGFRKTSAMGGRHSWRR
ncbi:hypothetical protein FNJ84_19150 [Paracoccus sp. M683]|uniref:hypothetical protein n=1 Tax=Paracoccus sp. M683 TaxID=2594268 RepID=UPI00117DF86A|nr:hypothetical protein [Paracoccus sp. M683]TRW94611.1 hypothetical protein FNJ84_19150 [Paracoccus sp. M683]